MAKQLKRATGPAELAGGARGILERIVYSGDPVVLLNFQICGYPWEVLDLRTLLAIGRESNPIARCASFALVLLSAARQQDVEIAAVAARVVLQLFEDPLDLCGVPYYWVTREQYVNVAAGPVIAALHALAALADDDAQHTLFTQAGTALPAQRRAGLREPRGPGQLASKSLRERPSYRTVYAACELVRPLSASDPALHAR